MGVRSMVTRSREGSARVATAHMTSDHERMLTSGSTTMTILVMENCGSSDQKPIITRRATPG